jgi:hypothetical protein
LVAIYGNHPKKEATFEVAVMEAHGGGPSQQLSSAPILTTHLHYVELWQQVAVSQSELIAIQKFPLRNALIFSTGFIHFFWEGRCQVII